ncbi:hypothetical protein A4R35_04275 [Thermogemmatispora tikiterensis]|uniref:Uncharacterized protein n=1 Tax=Thermogemmatispora tikiterensis TaxID=1825093 RepID=A0A328VG58_9CHLR|nr:hypothetical protein A4R35_04275 [Thermogemmatispora tikiterensis]
MARWGAELTPYAVSYPQQVEVLLSAGPALRPFAPHLLAAPGAANWFSDLDRQHQEWVSVTGQPPQAAAFVPDLRPWGAGITKPRQALWTSTSLSESSSNWLHYLRLRSEPPFLDPPFRRWRLFVAPSARVYEIHGPQDWHDLCRAYPALSSLPGARQLHADHGSRPVLVELLPLLASPQAARQGRGTRLPGRRPGLSFRLPGTFWRWRRLLTAHRAASARPEFPSGSGTADAEETFIEPDWRAVARDWDGVHLSLGGFLSSEGVIWGSPEEGHAHLFGWGTESTLWLHWAFEGVEPLPDAP